MTMLDDWLVRSCDIRVAASVLQNIAVPIRKFTGPLDPRLFLHYFIHSQV